MGLISRVSSRTYRFQKMAKPPSNPFKLDDHYDESFLLEDDEDDLSGSTDSLNDEQLPNEISKHKRPPSARHGLRSAHHQKNGYSGKNDINDGLEASLNIHSESDSAESLIEEQFIDMRNRPKSGRFKNPNPPTGPKREKSGTINKQNIKFNDNNSNGINTTTNSEGESENEESTEDEDFRLPKQQINNVLTKTIPSPHTTLSESRDSLESSDGEWKRKKKERPVSGKVGKNKNEDSTDSESEGDYSSEKFANLQVNKDIKELFKHITRYKPRKIPIPTQLKPFISDYIPAVGDIDAFLKIPRPDNKDQEFGLGWLRLDEPTLKQTDPAILDQYIKQHGAGKFDKAAGEGNFVHSIPNAEKNPKRIDNWISQISNLNRSKPSQTVHFSKPMPDVDSIMAAWPSQVEQSINLSTTKTTNQSTNSTSRLPSAKDLDCSLEEYSKIVCSLFDVPVYNQEDVTSGKKKKGGGSEDEGNNLIQSLHVLFSTFSQFKQLDFHNSGSKMSNLDKNDPFSGNLDSNVMTFD